MHFRSVGTSGLIVSEISLGTWGGGVPDAAERVGPCVATALDAGVTTFHSSPDWSGGTTEAALGTALAGRDRDRLVLCSGVHPGADPGAGPHDPWTVEVAPGLGRKRLTAAVRGTVARLRTDHVDVLWLLGHDHRTPLAETLLAVADLVRRGAVLFLGTAGWTVEQLATARPIAADLGVPLVADHAHYSMLWRVPEAQLMPYGERTGLGHVTFAPLSQGALTGKYGGDDVPDGSRAADPRARAGMNGSLDPGVLERIARLGPVADLLDLTPAQLAVAWVLQNPQVDSTVIGASNPAQVRENTAAAGVALPIETLGQVDALLGRLVVSDPRLRWVAPSS